MNTTDNVQAAAVIYRSDRHDRQALADFAREVASSGRRVGGMIQEAFFDDQGRRSRIDSVDLATGERVTINRPNRDQLVSGGCSLDTAALMDAGAPLRRTLVDQPDLVIVEKFGEQEQTGAGLADDILAVIAAGLPTLVLVPEEALESWRELTGGVIAELPCETAALRRWWPPP
ncbi:MAG: DUF2478 domain-containing protein [Gammaproteobacteria bacterium]|nr:DUF2478 domain-containing protein [Gammaproteobacteria bacterium]